MTKRNFIGSDIESTNRFRIYNAGQHYNLPTITYISKLHHKFRLDDLTVGLCTFVGASQQLNKEEIYGRNP